MHTVRRRSQWLPSVSHGGSTHGALTHAQTHTHVHKQYGPYVLLKNQLKGRHILSGFFYYTIHTWCPKNVDLHKKAWNKYSHGIARALRTIKVLLDAFYIHAKYLHVAQVYLKQLDEGKMLQGHRAFCWLCILLCILCLSARRAGTNCTEVHPPVTSHMT